MRPFLCKVRRSAGAFGLASVLAAAAGCSTLTSGSMRVDVDVYKGPLSLQLPAQGAELEALMQEGERSFRTYTQQVTISRCRLDCPFADTELVDSLNVGAPQQKVRPWDLCKEQDVQPHASRHGYEGCVKLRGMSTDALDALQKFETFNRLYRDVDDPLFLGEASKLATDLRIRAAFWASNFAATEPLDQRVRIEFGLFANLASEYSNQISARADSILKQHSSGKGGARVAGTRREQMPLSTYLRDAGTTAFLKLYDWEDTSVDRPDDSPAERVRMVQRLFDDRNWEQINSVYASGRGNVRMAFIKDDIGNWNLKSFSSDPTELVEAYTNVTKASLKAAAEIAAASASGGGAGAGQAALALASRLSTNRMGPAAAVGGFDLDSLHAEAVNNLKKLGADAAARRTALEGEITDTQGKRDAADTALTTRAEDVDGLAAKREQAEGKIAEAVTDRAVADLLDRQAAELGQKAGTPEEVTANKAQAAEFSKQAIEKRKLAEGAEQAGVNLRDESKGLELAKERLQTAQRELDLLKEQLAAKEEEQATLAKRTLERARDLLSNHQGVLRALEKSVASSSTDLVKEKAGKP